MAPPPHEGLQQRLKQRSPAETEWKIKRYKQFFSDPQLSVFFTGSFNTNGVHMPSDATAWRVAHACWRRLGQMAHSPTPAVVVIESSAQNQSTHVHFLIAGVDHLPDSAFHSAWGRGNTKVERPLTGGAPGYLAAKAAEGAPWERWPAKFDKALRRQRYLARKRKRAGEGIVLYSAGGYAVNISAAESKLNKE
jgi:hypothetical protein